MKQVKSLLVLTLITLLAGLSHAQKMKVEKGDFKFLSKQKTLNIEFQYDNLRLFKDKKTEGKYVKERAKELNEKEKGNGDVWKKKWEQSPELIWEPKFKTLLNRSEKLAFEQGKTDAKYTLIVDVVWIYPGWNAGVMKKGAKVTTVLKFVETANPKKVLLKLSSKDAPGDSFLGTFSNEDRIGEGFAKTGKTLMKLLGKKVK